MHKFISDTLFVKRDGLFIQIIQSIENIQEKISEEVMVK